MKQKVIYFILLSIYVHLFEWVGLAQAKNKDDGVMPPLKSGELIKLRASVAGVEGGTCELLVRNVQRVKSQLKLHATMHARSNAFFDNIHKVDNTFTSHFSFMPGSPFRYRLDADQGGVQEQQSMRFHQQAGKGHLTLMVKPINKKTKKPLRVWNRNYQVPSDTRDLVSALYYARFLPYQQGKMFAFHVFILGRVWRVEGKMTGKTRLYTALGAHRAIVIEAKAGWVSRPETAQSVRLWLSDDALRLPLQIEGSVPRIGVARAVIIGYRQSYKSRYIDQTNRRQNNRNRVWQFMSDF